MPTEPITLAEVAQMRELLANATRRPWSAEPSGPFIRPSFRIKAQEGTYPVIGDVLAQSMPFEDAVVAVAAVNALPRLLDAVERTQALTEAVEAWADAQDGDMLIYWRTDGRDTPEGRLLSGLLPKDTEEGPDA